MFQYCLLLLFTYYSFFMLKWIDNVSRNFILVRGEKYLLKKKKTVHFLLLMVLVFYKPLSSFYHHLGIAV